MALEADAVAGAMNEELAHARVGDDRARCAIDGLGTRRPGLTAASLAAWARWSVSYSPVNSAVGPEVGVTGDPHRARDVRAVAAQRPPMSSTIGSPAGSRARPPRGAARTSWARWRRSETGAVVALVDEALAHLARDVRLSAAHQAARGDAWTARSAACAASRSRAISSASLTARNGPSTAEARPKAASGTRLQTKEEGCPQPIRHEQTTEPTPRAAQRAKLDLRAAVAGLEELCDELERIFDLFPRDDIDELCIDGRRASSAAARSRRGTTNVAAPLAARSIVRRSSPWPHSRSASAGRHRAYEQRRRVLIGKSRCALRRCAPRSAWRDDWR